MATSAARVEDEAGRQPSWLPPRLMRQSIVAPRVDETQRAWGLLIAAYLFLGGVGAGSFAIAMVLAWAGIALEALPRTLPDGVEVDLSAPLVLWGPVAVAAGAALLLLHLGRNKHRFVTAGRNQRSAWLSRGFAILVAFIVLGGVVLTVAAVAPDWPGAHATAWGVLEGLAVFAALATATYTGLLLHSMHQIPAWHTPLLPTLFVVSSLATGAKALVLALWVARAAGLTAAGATADGASASIDAAAWCSLAVLAIEVVVLALYVRAVGQSGPTGERAVRLLLRGARGSAFWSGVVGLGIAAPLVLMIAVPASASIAAALAAAAALVGGFTLRLSVLAIGVRDDPPLRSLSVWRARGTSATAPGSACLVADGGTP